MPYGAVLDVLVLIRSDGGLERSVRGSLGGAAFDVGIELLVGLGDDAVASIADGSDDFEIVILVCGSCCWLLLWCRLA